MPLIHVPKKDWPRDLGWLVPGENCTELGFQICQRAMRDVGILEVPNGSNRGGRIDAMTLRAGLQPPVWWCAVEAGTVFADCDCLVPQNYPLTDEWLPYVRPGKWEAKPQPGDAVIYGLRKPGPVVTWGNAHHIGIVVRVPELGRGQRIQLTVEGNRSFAGTSSNNGIAVDIGPMVRSDILGYFPPQKAA
jgi:hypothetical protein